MKKHKRLLVSQCKYTKTPMSKFECFGHAVKGQCYYLVNEREISPSKTVALVGIGLGFYQ